MTPASLIKVASMRYVSLSYLSERSERLLRPARAKYVPRHDLNRRSVDLQRSPEE